MLSTCTYQHLLTVTLRVKDKLPSQSNNEIKSILTCRPKTMFVSPKSYILENTSQVEVVIDTDIRPSICVKRKNDSTQQHRYQPTVMNTELNVACVVTPYAQQKRYENGHVDDYVYYFLKKSPFLCMQIYFKVITWLNSKLSYNQNFNYFLRTTFCPKVPEIHRTTEPCEPNTATLLRNSFLY